MVELSLATFLPSGILVDTGRWGKEASGSCTILRRDADFCPLWFLRDEEDLKIMDA